MKLLKRDVRKSLKNFAAFRERIEARISACEVPGAADAVRRTLADIEASIVPGASVYCVRAHGRDVANRVAWLEQGFYSRVEGNSWYLADSRL